METKIVKCPKCATLMRVSNQNNESIIHFACPKCNVQLNVSFNANANQQAGQQAMQQPIQQPMQHAQPNMGGEPKTQYEANGGAMPNSGNTVYSNSGNTVYRGGSAASETQYMGGQSLQKAQPGQLYFGAVALPLRMGINIVGRRAMTSHANVQVPTDDHFMSRHHSKIDVVEVSATQVRVFISNAENKNPTYVNGQLLGNGDQLILVDGATIRMGNTNLVYRS